MQLTTPPLGILETKERTLALNLPENVRLFTVKVAAMNECLQEQEPLRLLRSIIVDYDRF